VAVAVEIDACDTELIFSAVCHLLGARNMKYTPGVRWVCVLCDWCASACVWSCQCRPPEEPIDAFVRYTVEHELLVNPFFKLCVFLSSVCVCVCVLVCLLCLSCVCAVAVCVCVCVCVRNHRSILRGGYISFWIRPGKPPRGGPSGIHPFPSALSGVCVAHAGRHDCSE